jgi:TRAP-type uncharacterized transport system fused permease subunit
MEYILITILQILGVGFHAAQKVAIIRTRKPEKKFKEIIQIFWHEDWNTFFVSGLVVVLNLVAHFIVLNYFPETITEHEWYYPVSFGIALVLGYAGQRMIYKYLGTAETFLNKQVADRLEK